MNSELKESAELHNSVTIPSIGLYADLCNESNAYDTILSALQIGIRHLHLNCYYPFEKEIARAIQDSGISRNDLFISAVYNADHDSAEDAVHALGHFLKYTGADYADCFILNTNHISFSDSWKGVEKCYKDGLTHSVGISGYSSQEIEHLLEIAEIVPMLNHIAMYPGFENTEEGKSCKEHAFAAEAYLPIDSSEVLSSREIAIFAEKYKKTPIQICTRYLLQKQCIAIIQSVNQDTIKNALNSFDFSIENEDMKYLNVIHVKSQIS